jgi:hypothetical protein
MFCHSFFMGRKVPPVEIHCELMAVYGANVFTVHVHEWCREVDCGQVNVMDEQRSGLPSMSAELVQDVDAAVQADRHVSVAQLERFNLSQGTIWNIVHECLRYRQVCSRWVPCQLTDEHK